MQGEIMAEMPGQELAKDQRARAPRPQTVPSERVYDIDRSKMF
jgi:hypothetical protein